ncbi:MAG: sialate O-acetylesterase [Planctomycetota bacterium]|jgi:hypothetical protein
MKSNGFLTTILVLIYCASPVGGEENTQVRLPSRENFHLFLLAGQSNMAGRGIISAEDKEVHPRVFMLSKDGKWEPAIDPIHYDKKVAGVGLGKSFALSLAQINTDISIGLVPAACGGSPISSWEPGGYHDQTKSHPYDDAIKRVRHAMKDGAIKGILWHQGESDCTAGRAPEYEEKLRKLINRFRKVLNAGSVPFIIGQLGRFPERPWNDQKKLVNEAHISLSKEMPLVGFVSSDGLSCKQDKIHFDSDSLRRFGRRYADVYLRVAKQGAQVEAANPLNNSTQVQVHHSSDFGWTANQDITGPFAKLLESGKLKAGGELVLDHRYRISGSHMLPDNFTLSAVKRAGFDVTDAAKPRNNRPLLELGNNNTLRNLTITYLDTPRPGPTGEERGVTFTSRLGIQARGKHDLMLRNCRLVGSIGHHLKLTDCRRPKVIGCHIAGGHWSTYLVGNVTDAVFRHCLIEKCQGDGIKTGGSGGVVRRVLVEECVFQDNLRDGIDTTGGFNDSVVRNTIFRRLGVSGMDIKSHYESGSGRIEELSPENVGILVENCLFHDMPNAIVLTTLDCGRRTGPGNELLNAGNIKAYAPHDIDVNNCVIGHAEKPLRASHEGGYGVNYPSADGEHMRMILLKDAYSIRYRSIRLSGERIKPVQISSIGGSRHLSEEAAQALEHTVTGNIVDEPAPPIKPGITEVPFACGPQALE